MKLVQAKADILPLIKRELPKVIAIMQSAGNMQWTSAYPTISDFQDDLLQNQLFYFEHENEIIGVTVLSTFPEEWFYEFEHENQIIPTTNEVMYIHRIFLIPDYFGKQLGKDMYQCIIDYAKQRGHLALQVDTHENNIPMQKTILQSGFIYTGSRGREKNDGLSKIYEYVIEENVCKK